MSPAANVLFASLCSCLALSNSLEAHVFQDSIQETMSGRGFAFVNCLALPRRAESSKASSFLTPQIDSQKSFACKTSVRASKPLQLFARSINLEIGVGATSLTALMINRLATLDLANAQCVPFPVEWRHGCDASGMCTCALGRRIRREIALPPVTSRADLLGVAVASAILVSALARIDLTVREKESVKLAGVDFDEVLVTLPPDSESLLRYAAEMILKVSESARSVVVYAKDTTIARIGTMGRAQVLEAGPIVSDAMVKRKQQYLADLQILPGRIEFGYLPVNTQAVLVQPIGDDGVMVIGADKVRPFTARDLVVIERLEPLLRSALQGG